MSHTRVATLVFVVMVQYELAASITSTLSSPQKIQRKSPIFKEQTHPLNVTIPIRNPTVHLKSNTPLRRHASSGSQAYIGWLKWKAYKKRRDRYRNLCRRYGPRYHKFLHRSSNDLAYNNGYNNHQYYEKPRQTFYKENSYPRRDIKKQHYQHLRSQMQQNYGIPSKHPVKTVIHPPKIKNHRNVVHQHWKKHIPWVTVRPEKIPDEFRLEEPLPELGGSPPTYPVQQIYSNTYKNIDVNIPSKHGFSIDSSSYLPISAYASDFDLHPGYSPDQTSSQYEVPTDFAADLSNAAVLPNIPLNKYSPVAENTRDYNWHDYNKISYPTTELPLVNSKYHYKQYEVIPITEYYLQNYNNPDSATNVKEIPLDINDSATSYSNKIPSTLELKLHSSYYESIPKHKQTNQNNGDAIAFMREDFANISTSKSPNSNIITGTNKINQFLKDIDKENVQNIYPPFKSEGENESQRLSGLNQKFLNKRNITKYVKPSLQRYSQNTNNSGIYNGHTYNISNNKEQLPKVVNNTPSSSEGFGNGEYFVTITPDNPRFYTGESEVSDTFYDSLMQHTDLRDNQDERNVRSPLARRIVKKEGVKNPGAVTKEAVVSDVMFVDDNNQNI